MLEDFDKIPVAVAAVVGLGQGLLGQTSVPATHKHAFTIYRSAVIAAGLVGELYAKWSPDIGYSLMTSGIALFAQRVPAAFTSGSSAFGYSSPVVAPRRLLPGGVVPGRGGGGGGGGGAGGCSSCGGGAAQPYAALGHAHRAAALSSRTQSAGGVA